MTCIAPTDVRALRRDGGDVAERGDDESAGYISPDPVVAFHEEAQRVDGVGQEQAAGADEHANRCVVRRVRDRDIDVVTAARNR